MDLPPEFIGMRDDGRPPGGATVIALAGVGVGLLTMLWAGREYLGDGLFKALLGVLVFWLILLIWLGRKYGRHAMPILMLAFVAQIAGCLMVPLMENSGSERGVRSSCGNDLRCIGEALKAYYAKHGSFPPAYLTDTSGERIHSWRTLLLPHLERRDLIERFDLTIAWDDPHNQEVSNTIIKIFRCPRYRWNRGATISYLAVIGPNTAWPGARGSKLEDFKDGAGNTILLIEVAEPHIPWAKPFDLDIQTMFSNPALPKPSSLHRHPRGFYALFADGSIRFLREDLDEVRLRALLTINGGENIDPKDCLVVERPDSS